MRNHLGTTGATADPDKVKAGMIFVDLSGKRDCKDIYTASKNGASLIFTSRNIFDPELPVIKVKDPHSTLVTLLGKFFGCPGEDANLIAVVGKSDSHVLMDMIECIMYWDSGLKSGRDANEIIPSIRFNRMMSIEGIFERICRLSELGIRRIPVSLNTDIKDLHFLSGIGYDCGILTDIGFHGGPGENNRTFSALQEFFSRIPPHRPIIINSDEQDVMQAVACCKQIIPITYGLNMKAAVTASSIDIDLATGFTYCLQRSFQTKSGNLVEPFETSVRMNLTGQHYIYHALAAVTCALYYDVPMDTVKAALESYRPVSRQFQRIYEGKYTVIDHYCRSASDMEAALEAVQILQYKRLFAVVSLDENDETNNHKERAKIIAEWSRVLNCTEVLLTSCMDSDYDMKEIPMKAVRVYKRFFRETELKSIKYYYMLQHALEHALSQLQEGDLLLILGGDEMNYAQRYAERYIQTLNTGSKLIF